MPYPYTCAGALTHIREHTNTAFSQTQWSNVDKDRARQHYYDNEALEAIWDIIKSLSHLEFAIQYITFAYEPFYPYGALYYYINNCIVIPEVDMSSIINAMLVATPDEITYFIGLADAFKQSTWNRPFNKQFYAALARGFEQWE